MRKIKEKLFKNLILCLIISAGLFFISIKVSSAAVVEDIWNITNTSELIADIAIDSSGVYSVGYAAPRLEGFDWSWSIKKYNKDNGSLIWGRDIEPIGSVDISPSTSIAIDSTGVYAAGSNEEERPGLIKKLSLENGDTIWSQIAGNYLLNKDIALTSLNDAFYVLGFDVFSGRYRWVIEKRNSTTGALDNIFGSGGVVIALDTDNSRPTNIAVGPDGFYIAGVTDISPGYAKWRIEKRNLTTGALDTNFGAGGVVIYDPHSDGGKVPGDTEVDTNGNDLFVGHDGLYAVNGFNAEKWSLSTGELIWRNEFWRQESYLLYDIEFDTANNLYAVGTRNLARFIAKLSPADGSLVWGQSIDTGSPRVETSLAIDPSGRVFYTGALSLALPLYGRVSKIGVSDFILNPPIPLRDATNPGWSEDYSVSIARQGGFNDAVNLSASVAADGADLNITWPNGNAIAAGANGPKTMRVQAKDPPTESKRGTNYDITITAVGGGITKNQGVNFYINQRPNAKVKAIGNTSINVGQSVKIRDDGSVDPDTLAPGNALTAVIADFNNDATLDINGNLIGIDKCFIVGDSGNICNALWPGSASSNPADFAGWSFQYNIAGAYSIRYFVFDDLIADAQAVNWTERFKSAGMATPIPVIVGPAPGQAPVAVIEIQNDNGMPIDQALPNQIFYAYAGKSSDSDGTIKQVSFCVDTTPEQGSVKVCDGSVMTWTFPPFDWDISDFQKNWLAIEKKLRGQISQPGTYAVYAVVADNDRMLSPVAMDTITIVNPSPPTADDQSVATNEDTPVGITLTGSGSDMVVNITNTPGNIHSLAVKADGTVWGWGHNNYNQAGDCTLADCFSPNKINGQAGFNNIIKVAAGYNTSIALKSDGTVWVWGRDGNMSGNPVAQQIAGLSNVVDVAAGGVDGKLYVLTQGSDIYSYDYAIDSLSLLSNLSDVIDIEGTDWSFIFAIKSDGTGWKFNPFSKLWVQVVGLDNVVKFSGNSSGSGVGKVFALKSNGEVWYVYGAASEIAQISGLANVVDIHGTGNMNDAYVRALKSDGTVYEWENGALHQVAGLNNVVAIGGGAVHTLALKSDGSLSGWGINDSGQLGNELNTCGGCAPEPLTDTKFPLFYIITSLPDNGALKTSAGTPITSVPFTLLDNIVNYTPKPNFFSPPTDPFKFKVNDGFQDSLPATVTVTVNPISPLPPTSLTGSAFCAGSNNPDISLSWTDNSDNETGFKIYRGVDQNFIPDPANLITTTVANATTYTDTSPAVSTTYYYKIQAFNTAGDSLFAASPAITTLSCAPVFALIPASVSILVGGTAQFDGSYDPDGPGGLASTTPDRDKIAWSSDKSNIARINQTGLVTGVVAGSAIIKGEYKGLIATSSVTVDPQLTYTLTVTKSGSGSGTVTSAPAGINCGADCSEPYTVGKSVTLTAAPGDFPNKFMGWTGAGCSGTGTCTVIMDAVKTVDAKFYLPTFTLTPASASILAGATQQFDGCYDDDGTGTEKSAICSPADLLRTAITWTSSDNTVAIIDSSGLAKGVKAGSVTITGIYNGITATASLTVSDIPTFSLTVTKAGSGLGTVTSVPVGIDCGADCSKSYPFGASVTLTAAPVNSTVVWTAGCDSIDGLTCTVAMTGDKAVTATFTALPAEADIRANDVNTITVPYNSSVEIEWCGADAHPCANAVACKVGTTIGGSDISLTAISGSYDTPALTADTTYFLECVNNAGDASYDNVKITVSAQAAYILTVTKTGAGSGVITSPPPPPRINCQASCASDSASFTSGASVTLTADPTIGSAFAGWSGDADCSDGNLTMNAAKTCTATFNTRPAAINLLAPNWSFSQASQLGALKAFLKWQFSDSNLNPGESAYQLIADDDADKADPLIDTGKCSGYNNPDAKCRINLGVDKYPLHEQISLAYDQKYYWWVKVWNNLGLESALKQYDTEPDTDNDDGDPLTFTTYSHEMPKVDFSWFPVNPSRGQATQFNNISQYYSLAAPATPTDCDDSHCSYLWTVSANATIDDNKAKNPKITFNFSGVASVTLTVTDKEKYVTSLTKTLNLRQKLPSWREVKPE